MRLNLAIREMIVKALWARLNSPIRQHAAPGPVNGKWPLVSMAKIGQMRKRQNVKT